MLYIDKLYVENWATWDKAQVDFRHKGVTFLRGKSKDAQGNPNKSGKSTLVNAMYTLIHGNHQLAVRKKAIKDVTRKDTRIAIKGHINDKDIAIRMLAGNNLQVLENGVDLEIHKKATAKEAINRLIPISPELWSSTVHVNGIDSNLLIRGTGAQRCNFLETIFQLNRWESRNEHIKDKMALYKRLDADIKEVEAELARMPPEKNVAKLEKELLGLKKLESKIKAKIKSYDKISLALADLAEKPNKPAVFYAHKIATLKKVVATHESQQEAYQEFLAAKTKYLDWIKTKKDLQAQLADYKPVDIEALQTQVIFLRDKLKTLKKDNLQKVKDWSNTAKAIAREHNIRFKSLEQLRSLAESWIAAIKDDASHCPVCGSAFKKRIEVSQLKDLQRKQHLLPTTLPDLDANPKTIFDQYSKLNAKLENAQKLARLKSDLGELEPVAKPDIVAKPISIQVNAEKLAEYKAQLKAAIGWEEHAELVKDWTYKGAKLELANKLQRLNRRLVEVAQSIATIANSIETETSIAESRKSLTAKLDGLHKEKKLHPIYAALSLAYSPKGLRLSNLYEILEALVYDLNTRQFGGRDQLRYSYKLTGNRELNIYASNMKATYDVRFLSGAESRFFCINLLMTLLPMLPSSQRVSLLVLDELEANMSNMSRSILVNDYIPRLAEIVPSLWIVTPHIRSDFDVHDSREFTVVKHNGTSHLTQTR